MVLFRRLLGDVLRAQRMRRGMTLREVSAEARVSLGYISEIERGQKEASSELLASLCGALEVPLSDVLREVSDAVAVEETALALEVASIEVGSLDVAGTGIRGTDVVASAADAQASSRQLPAGRTGTSTTRGPVPPRPASPPRPGCRSAGTATGRGGRPTSARARAGSRSWTGTPAPC